MDGKCGTCRKVVKSTEKAVECDLCKYWFHIKCAEVTDSLVKFLESSDGQNCDVHWYCKICGRSTKKILDQMASIDVRLTTVEEKLDAISTKLDDPTFTSPAGNVVVQMKELSDKVDMLVSKMSQSEEMIESSKQKDGEVGMKTVGESLVNTIVKELKERESREKNAIFSGNVNEDKVKLFLQQLGTASASTNVKKIGKPEKSVFLVEFESKAAKWNAIGKARETCAKHEDLKNVFVNPDLTRSEREVQYKLRQECRARRLRGENVKIKRGAIVALHQ